MRHIALTVLLLLISLCSYCQIKKSKGKTKQGKKVGIWEYFQYNGSLDFTYDYDNEKIVEVGKNENLDTVKTLILTNSTWIEVIPQRRAFYKDGVEGFSKHLVTQLRYPESAANANIQGVVRISFTIDSLGNASDFKIEESLQDDCDKEALRVLKTLPSGWHPVVYDNKNVTSKFNIPLSFRLNQ